MPRLLPSGTAAVNSLRPDQLDSLSGSSPHRALPSELCSLAMGISVFQALTFSFSSKSVIPVHTSVISATIIVGQMALRFAATSGAYYKSKYR